MEAEKNREESLEARQFTTPDRRLWDGGPRWHWKQNEVK